MTAKAKQAAATDPVGRAEAGVERAIGKLAALLGDPDMDVVTRAYLALGRIGPFAAGVLAKALARVEAPRHRALLLAALAPHIPEAGPGVLRDLLRAQRRETDPSLQLKFGPIVMHAHFHEFARGHGRELVCRLCDPSRRGSGPVPLVEPIGGRGGPA